MKLDRARVRHTCFRKRSNAAYQEQFQPIVDYIESIMEPHQKWEDFSQDWDVFVDELSNTATIISPETDIEFIRATCVKIKTLYEVGIVEPEDIVAKLDPREQNVYSVVELNYAGDRVPWHKYSKSWGIEVDYDAKRFEPYSFNTDRNEVVFPEPEEVREQPEGAAVINVDDWEEISEAEMKILAKMLKKKLPK